MAVDQSMHQFLCTLVIKTFSHFSDLIKLCVSSPTFGLDMLIRTQQTRNHFWTSWHMSYWFIIGTAPPVPVFMCIHVNTHALPVVKSFEQVWHKTYWVRTGTVSLVRVITWKTCDFTVNTWRHTKFVYIIQWIHVRKHVNWASWTREFIYRTCEIMGHWLLGSHVFIKFCTQFNACMSLPPMLIALLVHFASCCGVPINMYSILEWFNFSFMPSIQVLISLMHCSMDSRLMSIESGWKLQ